MSACRCAGVHFTEPRSQALAVTFDLRKWTSLVLIESEDVPKTPSLSAGALHGDTREAGGGTPSAHAELAFGAGRSVAVEPLDEREVLNVAKVADSHESHRNQEGSSIWRSLGATLLCVLSATTPFSGRPKRGQQLHPATVVTIMPPWKPDKRNVLVCKVSPSIGFAMIWWQSEMSDSKSSFKAFLSNEPPGFEWTLLLSMWPSVQSRWHKRLVPREVNHCTHAKRRNQLAATDRLLSRHNAQS
jgi:hypothetical protein